MTLVLNFSNYMLIYILKNFILITKINKKLLLDIYNIFNILFNIKILNSKMNIKKSFKF